MHITANHAHLMPPRAADSWWPEGGPDLLLRHLDACGIERVVIFAPFANQTRDDRRAANRWALAQARLHPDRFLAAGNLHPTAPDALELLRFFHAEGIRLAKIHPSIDLHDIADPAARPCYALAEELGIALDYHTGPHGTRLSLATPLKFDDVAHDFPKLILIFEHLGGRTYFEEFLAILCNHKIGRLYGGVTSVLNPAAPYWYLGPERLTDAVRCAGAGKLIFGLDFPWNTAEVNRRDIETLQALALPAADKENMLGGNLRRLLGV